MTTIPSMTAIRRHVISGAHDRARRALHAVRKITAAVAAAVGDAVRLVLAASGDGSPSPSPEGFRSPVPAVVPVRVVPVRVARLVTATARRQAGIAAHPAGSCRRW